MTKLCKCGCGEAIVIKAHHKWRGIPDFSPGHCSRVHNPMEGKHPSEKTRRKLSAAHKGKPSGRKGKVNSEAMRAKISAASKRLWQNPAYRELQSKLAEGRKLTEEHRAKISGSHIGKIVSDETRRRISESHTGKPLSPEHREKLSIAGKGKSKSLIHRERIAQNKRLRWADPDFAKKMGIAWGAKPNKPETILLNILESLYPGQWKYTGDFSFTISGKSPDFVNCNGQKKIIELFGDYWHRGDNPEDRAAIFAPFGYQTLVVWERELKHLPGVILRIRQFHEAAL